MICSDFPSSAPCFSLQPLPPLTRAIGDLPDAADPSNQLTVRSPFFPCHFFIFLCSGTPYWRPPNTAGHGAAMDTTHRRVPTHNLLPNEFARFRRSSPCILFRSGRSRTSSRRLPPCLPRRQPWKASRRYGTDGGGPHLHPVPSDQFWMAYIRTYRFGTDRSTVDL